MAEGASRYADGPAPAAAPGPGKGVGLGCMTGSVAVASGSPGRASSGLQASSRIPSKSRNAHPATNERLRVIASVRPVPLGGRVPARRHGGAFHDVDTLAGDQDNTAFASSCSQVRHSCTASLPDSKQRKPAPAQPRVGFPNPSAYLVFKPATDSTVKPGTAVFCTDARQERVVISKSPYQATPQLTWPPSTTLTKMHAGQDCSAAPNISSIT